MTKKRRMAVGVLTAVAAVLLGNTTVMAEAKAGEPVLSIETDRTEYSSTDPIMETFAFSFTGGGNGWHTSSGISDSESRRTRR